MKAPKDLESENEEWAALLLFPISSLIRGLQWMCRDACLSSGREAGDGWVQTLSVSERILSIDLLCVVSQHRILGCVFKISHLIFSCRLENDRTMEDISTLVFIFVYTISVHLGSGI